MVRDARRQRKGVAIVLVTMRELGVADPHPEEHREAMEEVEVKWRRKLLRNRN